MLEAMRLLPPAYMVGRCCTQQLRLGSYIVPKGKCHTNVLHGSMNPVQGRLVWEKTVDALQTFLISTAREPIEL